MSAYRRIGLILLLCIFCTLLACDFDNAFEAGKWQHDQVEKLGDVADE